MAKFKVGDRVRVVGGYDGDAIKPGEPNIGEVVTVIGLSTTKGILKLSPTLGGWDWHESRFELIDTPHTLNDCLLALALAVQIFRHDCATFDDGYCADWLRASALDRLAELAEVAK